MSEYTGCDLSRLKERKGTQVTLFMLAGPNPALAGRLVEWSEDGVMIRAKEGELWIPRRMIAYWLDGGMSGSGLVVAPANAIPVNRVNGGNA